MKKLLAVSVALAGGVAFGAVATWKGEDGDNLNDPANWDGDPGTLCMKFPLSATAKLSADWSCYSPFLLNGAVTGSHFTFDLAPYTLTATTVGNWQALRNHFTLKSGTMKLQATPSSAYGTLVANRYGEPGQENDYVGQKVELTGEGTKFYGGIHMRSYGGGVLITDGASQTGGVLRLASAYGTNVFESATLAPNDFYFAADPGVSTETYGDWRNATLSVSNTVLTMACMTDKPFYLAGGANASNNVMTVGGGSKFEMPRRFAMGYSHGHHNKFIVEGKGTYLHRTETNTVTITEKGTKTTAASAYYSDNPHVVGGNGEYNEYIIRDHALVEVGSMTSGGQWKSGSSGAGVTSRWNKITITDGGCCTALQMRVAYSHSDWVGKSAQSREMVVTDNGLEILNGGRAVVTNDFCVGAIAPYVRNWARVAGAGSLLQLACNCAIGANGARSNRLEVADGGRLEFGAASAIRLGSYSSEKGNIWDPGTEFFGGQYNVLSVENAVLTNNGNSVTLQIGAITNGNWNVCRVLDGGDVTVNRIEVRGFENEIVVSNGTLRTERFYPDNDNDDLKGGRTCLTFAGHRPRLVATYTSAPIGFRHGDRLVYRVPADGFESVPLFAKMAVTFDDTCEMDFDFDAYAKNGGGIVPLITSTSGNTTPISISETLLEKFDAAAKAKDPKARVYFAEKKNLVLKVPNRRGLVLIFK